MLHVEEIIEVDVLNDLCDEMQRLELVLVVYDGISLNTWAWVKQWLWGFGWWSFLDFCHAY